MNSLEISSQLYLSCFLSLSSLPSPSLACSPLSHACKHVHTYTLTLLSLSNLFYIFSPKSRKKSRISPLKVSKVSRRRVQSEVHWHNSLRSYLCLIHVVFVILCFDVRHIRGFTRLQEEILPAAPLIFKMSASYRGNVSRVRAVFPFGMRS